MLKITYTLFFLIIFQWPTYALEVLLVSERPKHILFKGEIVLGDSQKILRILEEHQGKLIISMHSTGGIAKEGLSLGVVLHQHPNVIVMVQSGQVCSSACSIALLGAKNRIIHPGARLGFHRPHIKDNLLQNQNKRQIEKDSIYIGFVMSNYSEYINIDKSLLYKTLDYGPDEMWYLNEVELRRFRINTIQPGLSLQ